MNVRSECQKCGQWALTPLWHFNDVPVEARAISDHFRPGCGLNDITRYPKEHLHWHCTCGFDWTTYTNDCKAVGYV